MYVNPHPQRHERTSKISCPQLKHRMAFLRTYRERYRDLAADARPRTIRTGSARILSPIDAFLVIGTGTDPFF